MRENNGINNAETKIQGSKETNNPKINLGNTSRIHWKWRKSRDSRQWRTDHATKNMSCYIVSKATMK